MPEDAIIRRNTAAIATLSMFNSGEVRRNGFENSQTNIIQQRLKRAQQPEQKRRVVERSNTKGWTV